MLHYVLFVVMESQVLLAILLVLTVLLGYGWTQSFFGTVPPRSIISDINVFCNINVSHF